MAIILNGYLQEEQTTAKISFIHNQLWILDGQNDCRRSYLNRKGTFRVQYNGQNIFDYLAKICENLYKWK